MQNGERKLAQRACKFRDTRTQLSKLLVRYIEQFKLSTMKPYKILPDPVNKGLTVEVDFLAARVLSGTNLNHHGKLRNP